MATELYRQCLQTEFANRCERNPRYSSRAFARALGISQGALSEILSGKRVPSYPTAQRLSQALDFSPDRQREFMLSLAQKHSTRTLKRTSRKFRDLKSSPALSPQKELSIALFQVMADWYHVAILELTFVEDFKPTPSWIARRLGISVAEAQLAVARLLELGMLREESGKLTKSDEQITTADKHLSTPALRKFQKQVLDRAIQSLESDPVEERSHTAMAMAIDPAKLPAAKKMIQDFNRDLCKFLESGSRKQVYQLGVCLYPLTVRK
jgi:uncharacterized protein (TIGR02147 family)